MNEHFESLLKLTPQLKEMASQLKPDSTIHEFHDKIVSNLRLELPRHQVAAVFQLCYHTIKYYLNGCKDYVIMPAISDMLENTSIDIEPTLLHSPFPEICIQPPHGYGSIWNQDTGWHKITMMYISLEDEDEGKQVRIMIIGGKNKKSFTNLDDATYYFRCKMYDDKTVEQSFKQAMGEYAKEGASAAYDVGLDNIMSSERYFKYCLNVLLYITSMNADMEWKHVYPIHIENRMKKLQDDKSINRLKKKNKARKACVVGSNIILEPSKYVDPSGEDGEKWRLSKRVHVSGHYHGYWTGPRDGDRKLVKKWLAPYWKGPDAADQVHRKFQVGRE